MFQTVGHNLVEAIAQAMEVPLFRHPLYGNAKNVALTYSASKGEGEEVEDLYGLLEKAKVSGNTLNSVTSATPTLWV